MNTEMVPAFISHTIHVMSPHIFPQGNSVNAKIKILDAVRVAFGQDLDPDEAVRITSGLYILLFVPEVASRKFS